LPEGANFGSLIHNDYRIKPDAEQERRAAVEAAHAKGAKIEFRRREDGAAWMNCSLPLWNWTHCDYRVAPVDPLAEIKAAHAAGKRVQAKHPGGTWHDVINPAYGAFDLHAKEGTLFRLRPEPTLRPWTADEVPVGAVLRDTKHENQKLDRWLIVGCVLGKVIVCAGGEHSFDDLLKDDWEVSVDGGKTWGPCGVEVTS
jgi:hypothetical protein